jgi:DNA-directed RNA polymerase alpha subunit
MTKYRKTATKKKRRVDANFNSVEFKDVKGEKMTYAQLKPWRDQYDVVTQLWREYTQALKKMLMQYTITGNKIVAKAPSSAKTATRKGEKLKKSDIKNLNLSLRTTNSLYREGIMTIPELRKCTLKRLKGAQGMGVKGIDEISQALAERNWKLKEGKNEKR